jgi:response regulator RpfG family c-di-GMP phosphodiesterase
MVTNEKPPQQDTTVLVVDDEEPLRKALARFLQRRGYPVLTAGTGPEALERVKVDRPGLVLLDIRMPGMSGIDVIPEALSIDPDLAIVMLSGVGDATTAALCMQRGALDYLTKPIALPDLGRAVERAIRRRDTIIQEKGISSWLKGEVSRQSKEIKLAENVRDDLVLATLEALVNALEAKNQYFGGHSARVAAFSATIATELSLSDEDVEQVRVAGRLHDLGVIGIRDEVLEKTGSLSDEEYEHVKQHVTIGSHILSPLTPLGAISEIVRTHHERWDGSGYPEGLKGDDILIGARVINAAETYDALTTSRPYREKLDSEEAVSQMRAMAGKVLDPAVMDALAKAVSSRQALVFIDGEQTPNA